jgi:hypothetical protein
MARREATDVQLITRNGNDLISRFPHIAVAVAALPAQSCLIDGEVIVCDPSGLAVFDLMLGYRAIASTVLCAFDLLELNGEDLRCKPIESRKDALNQLLRRADAAVVVFNQHYKADGETLFRAACRPPGHRVEAAWLSLLLGPIQILGESQKPKSPSRETPGRGGLGPLGLVGTAKAAKSGRSSRSLRLFIAPPAVSRLWNIAPTAASQCPLWGHQRTSV